MANLDGERADKIGRDKRGHSNASSRTLRNEATLPWLLDSLEKALEKTTNHDTNAAKYSTVGI